MSELYRLPTGGARAAGIYPTVVVGVSAVFVLTLWSGTQTAAALWRYAPSLGTPMMPPLTHYATSLVLGAGVLAVLTVVCGVVTGLRQWTVPVAFLALYCYALATIPVYTPWHILLWWARFHWQAQTAPVFAQASKVMALVSLGGLALVITVAIQKAKKIGGKSDLYGSAEWGTEAQVRAAGLLAGRGLLVGMWPQRSWRGETMVALRDDGPEPVLVIGPNRSGKGVGFVIPNALTWSESMVLLDPKGENWTHSAGWRSQQGYPCLKLDPTCFDGTAAHWNPLEEMPASPFDVPFAQTIAQAIMESEEFTRNDETSNHFRNTAEQLLQGVLLHVWYAEKNKSLAGCLHLLTNPSASLADTLKRMRTTIHDPDGKWGWVDPEGNPTRTHPVVAAAARAVENKGPNESSSVVSTAIAFFTLYQDPMVAKNTSSSDFRVRDVIDPQRQPVSIYITIPTPEMIRLKPFVRIFFYLLLHHLTAELRDASQGWAQRREGGRRVLLLMDEFPMLGNMRLFHQTLPVMAGYGIKVLLAAQDIAQIYRVYGKEESITSNCAVQVAFAPNRTETAKWISERSGVRTVYRQQRTYTGNRFAWYLPHVIASEQEAKRELVTEDEAMRLPDTKQFLFVRGVPFLTHKIRHYLDVDLHQRSLIPAPVQSDCLLALQVSPCEDDDEPSEDTLPVPINYAEEAAQEWYLGETE